MTSDRPTGQPLVAPSAPKDLNPTAPVFRQGGQDKGPQNSFSADVSEKDLSKDFKDALNLGQPLTNGDVHAASSGVGNYFGASRGWVSQPFQPRMPSHSQGAQSPAVLGMNIGPASLISNSGQNGHQPYSSMGTHSDSMVNARQSSNQPVSFALPDGPGGEPVEGQGSSPNDRGGGDNVDADGAIGGAGVDGETPEEEWLYPEEIIAPIRKQLEYYFSQENLPHDKYINQHMDSKKFVPLSLFPDFNRMKPICSSIDQIVQAVKTSSLLELNEDKTRVRISQTRKTLTLRGLPPDATQDDIHKLLRDNECPPAHHIEVIIVHTVSNWYVNFATEAQCMETFFKLHNSKVTVDGFPIGCCIKSSGTHVATGYFPSQEEHSSRRMTQNPANVTAPVQGSITQQPALQQPPALMQQYNHVHLHPSLMPSAGQGLYFSQSTPYLNMPYMPGMITQSWPGTTGLDPGLMLQSSGLQPQHIRTSLPRPLVQGAPSHRFHRPPRQPNRQNIDRNSVSQVSVSNRNSPRGMDGSLNNMIPHGASHISRRSNMREDIAVTQHATSHHQYVTPVVTGVPSTTAIVNPTIMEGVNNTASLPHTAVNVAAHPMPQPTQQPQQQQPHSHPQSVLIQQSSLSVSNPSTPNPLPQPHQHHHHHHQPPPPQLPHQLPQAHQQQQPQQQQPQHTPHQQQSQHHHSHHSLGNHSHHSQPHIGGQQQQPPQPAPPSVTHQHQQPSLAQPHQHVHPGHHHHQHHHQQNQTHHHHHHHAMMPSQHPHQPPPNDRRSLVMPPHQPPPQAHHHQQSAPMGNRRNRRRREETTNRNQRERNLSNRANFSSQAPAAADNFTMEANSFPPLPGAANAPSSDTTPENRMMHSDIVKGISRISSLSSNASLPVRGNSSTPSPVATPTLTPSHVPSSAPAIVDIRGGDDIDSVVDDDTASSSQEEAEVDVPSVESVSGINRQGRCDVAMPVTESSTMPAQSRHVKGSAPVLSPNTGPNMRQGQPIVQPNKVQQQSMPLPQQAPPQQPNVSVMSPGASMASAEMPPKLSYAQILFSQNKREMGNNAIAESNMSAVTPTSLSNPNATVASSTSAAMNGPVNNSAVPPVTQSNTGRAGSASNNAFRDQGNYPSNTSHRPPTHRSPKDGQSRNEGPQSRMPNGRRNSKENRNQGNKFEKKKPDGRPK